MAVITGLGKRLASALVFSKSSSALMQLGGIQHLVLDHEKDLIDFIIDHAKKYGDMPSAKTVEAHTGIELDPVDEKPEYYRDLMQKRYVEQGIKKMSQEALDWLDPEKKDVDKAFQIVREMVMDGMLKMQGQYIFDFRKAYDMVIPHYLQAFKDDGKTGVMMGWPFIDEQSGGISTGDLISFVGRPMQGKTWFLLFACLYAWWVQGKSVLFISMEMNPLPIMQRLASMHSRLPFGKVRTGGLHQKDLTKLKTKLKVIEHKDAAFWVIDGNLTAMVEDVWAMAATLHPDLTAIDGGYLMKHPKEKDRFKRVAENCNLIKQSITPLCPTLVSWQFSKTGAAKNKKKGEQADLEDIGYTDAIAQDSSIVLGVIQPESVETVKEREVLLLKGRNGERGKFRTNWLFDAPNAMNFEQVKELKLEDLKFG